MRQRLFRRSIGALLFLILLLTAPVQQATGQLSSMPAACQELAFSTEEDFLTGGAEPPDGNPVISDGDLLSTYTDVSGNEVAVLCARNLDLLHGTFDVDVDLGLDAVDVVDAETALAVFSTELNSPNLGQFTQGDMLVTNGTIILNTALTAKWQVGYDLGLDAVHLLGPRQDIPQFLDEAAGLQQPIDATELAALFESVATVDILFSTEGTFTGTEVGFLDGDLLSARNGAVAVDQKDFPPDPIPAGIPQDGVDFGLDAATLNRIGELQTMHGSTEILLGDDAFTSDGDVIRSGAGAVIRNDALLAAFVPAADELGLDALHIALDVQRLIYLSVLMKNAGQPAMR